MTRARAAALGAMAACLWLLVGLWQAPQLGLHIDEASYLTADLERLPWFYAAQAGNPAAWQPDILHQFWRYTVYDCHPFLLRLLTGLSLLALPQSAGSDGLPLAWRLPNIIVGMLATGILTAVAARLWGIAGWLGAAAALLASPRFLAYAFLATHDPTVTFLGALAALAAWAWLPTGRAWLIVPAAFLMFAAKINALPLAAGLFVWAWLAHGPRMALRLGGLLLLAGVVYLLAEPQFWYHRWSGLRAVLDHHLLHRTYPLQLLGRAVTDGRNEALYPLLQFLTAVPLAHLLLAGLGVVRRRPVMTAGGKLLLLAAVEVLGCLLLAMFPGTPKYGGIRVYLLPALPFLALFIAYGARCAWQWSPRRAWRVVLTLVLFLPLLDFARLQPQAVLYANALVGGAAGSWRLGNEIEGEFTHLTPAILADLQYRAGGSCRIIVSPECPLAMNLYRQAGIYREATRPAAPVWLVLPLGHNADSAALRLLAARPPDLVYGAGGVPLLQVYRLR